MKRVLYVLGVSLLIGNFSRAQDKSTPTPKASSAAVNENRASAAEESTAAKLPVRRVVLYKNGVGYFEHLGRVHGNQDVHVDFTSAQLNDVLKSLTVLDLAGGRIIGVDYNSEAPLARRLATLRLALGEKPSEADFLGALRGATIQVRGTSGEAVTGKLLSVERKTRTASSWTVETDEISLVTDSGEIRSIDLNPATGVRIVDHDLQLEVGKYLGLIASARDQDVRRMTISTTGAGDRNLYVSYISEVPIWKTTYRIVLPTKSDKKPLLQGWAIVDNTVGEDWDNVELSLVAGAPHSFIQQLSEPYYGRRPVVGLPESVQLSPQTHAGTLSLGNGRLSGAVTDPSGAVVPGTNVRLLDEDGNPVAQTVADSSGQYSFSSLAAGNYQLEFTKPGFRTNAITNLNVAPGENQFDSRLQVGAATETVTVEAESPTVNTSESTIVNRNYVANTPHVANKLHAFGAGGQSGNNLTVDGVAGGTGGGRFLAGRSVNSLIPLTPGGVAPNAADVEKAQAEALAAASGQSLGDLFEYKLKDRVSLKKNQSALVPIAQTEIDAEKVSIWSGAASSGRPLRGLWLKNSSSLTLDGGSFSVLEDEVFAGEGLTDAIKPGERRLISYATDLGLLVDVQRMTEPKHVTRVKISKGVLTQLSELQEHTIYTVRNEDDKPRDLIVEHPAKLFWSLVRKSKEPEEKAPGVYRFRLSVASKATASLPVEESHTEQATYQLGDLDDEKIGIFVKQGTINAEVAQALGKITAQKTIVAKLEEEMDNRQKDIDRIVADQARLRENMKALKGGAEEKALLQRYTRQLDEQETHLDSLRKKIQETETQRDKANDGLERMIADLQIDDKV
jgi:hypothetical protein